MDVTILQKLINNTDLYEAHILKDEEDEIVERELLMTHTSLTVQYFERIWNEKGIDAMLERFCKQVLKVISPEAKEFLKELVMGIPLFHDFGKINPEFQKNKMKNKSVHCEAVFSCVGSRHSIISAIAYLDYYLEQLKTLSVDSREKKELRRLLIFHAYIVERHHSDLSDFNDFIKSLLYGSGNDVMEVLLQGKCKDYKGEFSLFGKKVKSLFIEIEKMNAQDVGQQEKIGIYTYVKMLYSVLVASDYYATSEFMDEVKIEQFGDIDDISDWIEMYEDTDRMQTVRRYEKNEYPKAKEMLDKADNINPLRMEMLLDAEQVLKENVSENLFYLEAPTGSGKSNTAMNLSFQLIKNDPKLKKIYYIYPFNTLVEQNRQSLEIVFEGNQNIMDQIAVVNSITPIKMTQCKKQEEAETEDTSYYQRALLDRQFLNYPMILSTHVSIFDTMFGDTKESAFGFHQLMNSVIILDEIQSYKNIIWSEIICFLKEFAYLLNIKVIIMSATLPNLDLLSPHTYQAVQLIKDREKYFSNRFFRERVTISYELLKGNKMEISEDMLMEHILHSAESSKKVLVEFIKKSTASHFYNRLMELQKDYTVEYMSGDDSLIERSRILERIKETTGAMILVATQVIEAGVDIDMDIGYKNVSKLDSEEQFLGRTNRSNRGNGIVYFFKIDDAKKIYGNDIRSEKEFTIENEEMRDFLETKDFKMYYNRILQVLKKNYNESISTDGLKMFFDEQVGGLQWSKVKERMKLISEDNWSMSVYLARVLETKTGELIDGQTLWAEYIKLLQDFSIDYAEKKFKLSKIISQMNYFIYQIKRNYNLTYNDHVGDIYYIEEGERYFDNGKLNRAKIQSEVGEFVNFI